MTVGHVLAQRTRELTGLTRVPGWCRPSPRDHRPTRVVRVLVQHCRTRALVQAAPRREAEPPWLVRACLTGRIRKSSARRSSLVLCPRATTVTTPAPRVSEECSDSRANHPRSTCWRRAGDVRDARDARDVLDVLDVPDVLLPEIKRPEPSDEADVDPPMMRPSRVRIVAIPWHPRSAPPPRHQTQSGAPPRTSARGNG